MTRTLTRATVLALAGASTFMLAAAAIQPDLPTGHPAVSSPKMAVEKSNADPADVESIDAVLNTYYDSISGGIGEPRDWDRFLSLFSPDTQFIVARTVNGESVPLALTPQEFVDSNKTYFEKGGYFEKDIHRQINTYGNIAQVFSTYASRRTLEDPEPYSRGINSMQLMRTGDRWWITTIMWESERPDINPIPATYLPAPETDG